jgi:hypothetical protein
MKNIIYDILFFMAKLLFVIVIIFITIISCIIVKIYLSPINQNIEYESLINKNPNNVKN